MLRRNFIRAIGYTTIAYPCIAMAQQTPKKIWRIAHVYPGKLDNPPDQALYDVFRGELRNQGFIEGKNLVIDQRSAEGRLERLPAFIAS
jgi:putative ABC transport system substrate-binding protein